MDRASRITRELKYHDRDLYCEKVESGTICIFRKIPHVEVYTMDGGERLVNVRSTPHFVTALTHNWGAGGEPADWGLDNILNRVKSLDLWSTENIHQHMISNYEKANKAMERDQDNKMEDFAREFRRDFQKATSDIRVCNMDMKKDLRRLKEK